VIKIVPDISLMSISHLQDYTLPDIDSLAQLGLNLASLDIDDTNVSNDLALLPSLFPELVEVIVSLSQSF